MTPTPQPDFWRERIYLIIPAHNEEVGITAAMASVEVQTMQPDLRVVMSDNSTDDTVEIARSRPGWHVWKSSNNTGKKGGALNQAWKRLNHLSLDDDDFLVTMDADTILDPFFIENAYAKFMDAATKGYKIGGVCANFMGMRLGTPLGALQMMEYARAEKINQSRRGIAPVLAGAATMFSVRALRAVSNNRGRLYEPVLTEDYELTLALRVQGYDTMAPKNCKAHTELMPNMSMLWAQRMRWYRGAFESLRNYGFVKHVRADIGWIAFSLWSAASRWLFLAALLITLLMVGHMNFSPYLLSLFGFASLFRVIQVRALGWKYMLLAGFMVEELYYALFLETVLWRSAYLAFFSNKEGEWH